MIEWLSVNWSLSPFGPPYIYLLMCIAWMWASIGIRERVTRHLTFALVSSGTLYSLALFVIGIAHEYRYIYWTMLAALDRNACYRRARRHAKRPAGALALRTAW